MSSLRGELEKMNPIMGGLMCHVCEAMKVLDPDDAKALQDALESRKFHATMIAKALENVGQPVSVGSVRRHRRGECAAGKKA